MTPAAPAQDEQPAAPLADNASMAPPSSLTKMLTPIRRFTATRRFGLWSSLVVITACGVLLGLGTWQIARLHQKNALVAHIQSQLRQPERDLRLRPPTDEAAWRELDYRRVVLQGDWLDLYPIKLLPRTYEGQNGYHLLLPLRLANGQIVLVNRGWVPDKTELGPSSMTATGNLPGALVAGIVRTAPDEKPFGMMDNVPAKNVWAWPDRSAIADRIGVGRIAPVILYAERAADDTADTYPIGGQAQLTVRNEHKQYALTWYGLALALLVIWLAAAKGRDVPETVAAPVTDD